MRKRILYTALLILFIVRSAFPTTYGFFVDGGYSDSKTDTDMDKMLDKRIDDAMDNMKDKDPNSVRKKNTAGTAAMPSFHRHS